MRIVGLTGNIGSGKSTFAELIRKEGLAVIDLDAIGREISTGNVLKEMNRIVGLDENNQDRSLISSIIFNDSKKKQLLEGHLHPLIQKEFERRAAKLGKEIVICEAALLRETDMSRKWDLIVVASPKELRWKRVASRGISRELFDKISASQKDDSKPDPKIKYWVENSGSEKDLEKKAKEVAKKIIFS